jgi:Ca2+-transporting ATPase
MEIIVHRNCHHVPAEEVIQLLGTDLEKGLDLFEVGDRQARFGPNTLTERKGHGPVVRFLLQFHQPLIYILLAAALITGLLKEWVDASVIFGVVLVNVIVGFIQETKAVKAVAALAKGLVSEATVIRAGEKTRVSSSELVPGDIVFLQSGDRVPADLRLARTRDLQIDESALTGESVPVEKRPDVQHVETPLADRKNMAYSSTLVTYGTGTAVVVATGDKTEIGQISEMVSTAEVLATPLTRKIKEFSNVLLVAILGLSVLTFLIGILRGHAWYDTFMAAVAIAVGAIPEGLPAAVTVMLAIGVSRMAKRRAIIRRLPAVEALGSTTVICSDKTGTLTKGEMTVQEIFAGGQRFEVSGAGYNPEGEILQSGMPVPADSSRALLECLRAGLLCNDAVIQRNGDQWKVQGDPTEGALLVSGWKGGLQEQGKLMPRIDSIPFESQNQYMATLHAAPDTGRHVIYLKGSVESILARCDFMLDAQGRLQQCDAPKIAEEAERLAAKALRVLAFARKELTDAATSIGHEDVGGGLTFLGLQGMLDPPRPEAARAVATCQRAGIQVKMITGDHALTATAIARQVGIDGAAHIGHEPRALSGRELSALSDAQLIEIIEEISVIARVSPEQKLRLVHALQARGHIVAMTGDGVNDAPALRRADIGVAMALSGTEVAREASDMVLTDDNFASIEAAVEEGRGVFDNLMKFIVWTLPTNGGEALVLILAIILGTTLPILPVQILWINMTTAGSLGLMLAFEPKEKGIMDRQPRRKAGLLSRDLLLRIGFVSVLLCAGAFLLFEWEYNSGTREAEARTVAVAFFVFGELFYLFNCRSLTKSMFAVGLFSNKWVWIGVGGMTVLQLFYTYHPTMNRLFDSAPIRLEAWWAILGLALVVSMLVGLEKWFRRNFTDPVQA